MKPTLFVGAALLAAACEQTNRVTVVSDLPLQASTQLLATSISNAIRQTLDEAGVKACNGTWRVHYEPHDDASMTTGSWDEATVAANAKAYLADPTVGAVIGPLNSGAAAILVPALNPEGLVVISPANTYPGLTQSIGAQPDEPAKYYPSGVRNYARLLPSDHLQGEVAANWAKELGATTVHVVDNGGLYGAGLAGVFMSNAVSVGLSILQRETAGSTTDYAALAARVQGERASLVYYGGDSGRIAKSLFTALAAAGYAGLLMGGDGLDDPTFIADLAGTANGLYLTTPGVPVDQLTGAAAAWRDAFTARFGTPPLTYSAEAHVAMRIVLATVERVCRGGERPAARNAMRAELLATRDFASILGTISFDENGDIANRRFSGKRVVDGALTFVRSFGGP